MTTLPLWTQRVGKWIWHLIKTYLTVPWPYLRPLFRPWYLHEGSILTLITLLSLYLIIAYAPQSVRTKGPGLQTVIIKEGMGVWEIGCSLKEAGLIDQVSDFVLLAKLRGLDKRLQAQRYRFVPGMSLAAILDNLARGKSAYDRVTIPEGLTAAQIAGLLQREAALDSAKFMHLVTNKVFCASLGIRAKSLEGYLFPDTYYIYWHMKEEQVIRRLVARFQEVFTEGFRQRAKRMGFSQHEIITLASIIEREAQVAAERPIISAVFHNRFRLGRALQADPTVLYALGRYQGKLSKRDLKVKSPYNTYLHPGLPPGPICNPGLASIKAALYPADVDYLYFVARGDGTHIFTRSNREHIRAKISVKRREKRKKFQGTL